MLQAGPFGPAEMTSGPGSDLAGPASGNQCGRGQCRSRATAGDAPGDRVEHIFDSCRMLGPWRLACRDPCSTCATSRPPGPLGASVRRTVLDHGAWVDMRRGWMAGADVLFDRLREHRAVARGAAPDVRPGGRRPAAALLLRRRARRCPTPCWTRPARPSTRTTAAELGEPFRTAGLCLYRDGRDSVAWHGDRIGRGATDDTMVAIVSVGAPRSPAAAARAAAARRCATTSATATCW